MTTFPLYRKYPHERTFFKLTGPNTFVQLDIIGTAYNLHAFTASVYPDKLLILDMIACKDGYWLESTEKEYEDQLAYCQQHLMAL